MRILICDSSKINSFDVPSVIETNYIIDYKFNNMIESLTIDKKDDKLYLVSSPNIQIKDNQQKNIMFAELSDYQFYYVHFFDINTLVILYCYPDSISYRDYNISSIDSISIGMTDDCNIKSMNVSTTNDTIYIKKSTNENLIFSQSNKAFFYHNNKRKKKAELKFGDFIFINGIQVIYMDTFIRINNDSKLAIINNLSIIPLSNVHGTCSYTPANEFEKNSVLYNESQYFFHTPHLISEIKSEEVKIDNPPEPAQHQDNSLLIGLSSSLVLGVTSISSYYQLYKDIRSNKSDVKEIVIQIIACSAMLLSSILLPVISVSVEKRNVKRKEKKRNKKYSEYLDQKTDEINQIVNKQSKILNDNYVNIQSIINNIVNKSNDVWSREIIDNDFLTVRLGVGNLKSDIKINAPEEHFTLIDDVLKDKALSISKQEKNMMNVPVTISFLKNKVTPLLINSENKKYYINSILLQLLYYHSALDLKIVVFTTDNDSEWEFLKYMPHCFSSDRSMRFYSNNSKDSYQVAKFLEQEYQKRKGKNGEDDKNKKTDEIEKNVYKNYSEYYLIITDDFKTIKNLSIVENVLNDNGNYGFSIMLFEDSMYNLPSRFEKYIEIKDLIGGIYPKNLNNDIPIKFNAEYYKFDIKNYANIIANIPIEIKGKRSDIPSSISFLDMYKVGKVEQLNCPSRWKKNDPTTSLSAQVGVKEDGIPLFLDLHEKFHGPHGLIAGSTGSGKSEFIITYILSMCVNYDPKEVQFVLIDYKGGGLVGAFQNKETGVKIPHLVGTITNLDTNQMSRTLVSLQSELKRRQQKFNEVRDMLNEGTIDIYKYQKFYREGIVKEPISHLFVISDEFAELKQQQPDFMDELISTARIGRSLGVHLILATQKPAGIVDDQIWSNSRFRICLKVQTTSDSNDVLKKPDAAEIKEQGRFYLQVGNDELFEYGQSAWAGAKYIPTDKIVAPINDSIDFISDSGDIIKSINNEVKVLKDENYGEQLTNIVKYLNDNYIDESGAVKDLWLPMIPEEIFLEDLIRKYNYEIGPLNYNFVIGEYDLPEKQYQGIYTLDLLSQNTAIYGLTGSGKENLLITLIFYGCLYKKTEELNFYIIDFGSQALNVLSRLPQVGSYITASDVDKINTTFDYLNKEINKRKELFSEYSGNYESYCGESGNVLPLIIVVINSYETFTENFDLESTFSAMLRDGSKYGVEFIITSASVSSVRSYINDFFTNKIMMQVNDEYDYYFTLGSERGKVPKKCFGRGLANVGNNICEFQTALITKRENINDLVRKLGNELLEKGYKKAFDIKPLPSNTSLQVMLKYCKDISKVPIGYSIETSELLYYDFIVNKKSFIYGDKVLTDLDFLSTLIDLIDSIKNLELNVFDIGNLVNMTGNMNYYNDNFIENFNVILNQSNKYKVNIFIGIGFYKTILGVEECRLLEKILNNIEKIPNSSFIFVDDYERYSMISDETWINNSIRQGIWHGPNFDIQEVFKVDHINKYDIDIKTRNTVYVCLNNRYTVVKGVGIAGDDLYE